VSAQGVFRALSNTIRKKTRRHIGPTEGNKKKKSFDRKKRACPWRSPRVTPAHPVPIDKGARLTRRLHPHLFPSRQYKFRLGPSHLPPSLLSPRRSTPATLHRDQVSRSVVDVRFISCRAETIMGSSDQKAPRAAYVYEVDEEGRPVGGTKRSARRREEKPTVSHRKSDDKEKKRQSRNDSGTGNPYEEMMPGARHEEALAQREIRVERLRSSASSPTKQRRPSSSQENKYASKPKVSNAKIDQASYYGIPAPKENASTIVAHPIPFRPRAHSTHSTQAPPPRPASYYSAHSNAGYGTGPPLSSSAYWQPPPALPAPTPSYPPPSPSSYMSYPVFPTDHYLPQPLPQPTTTRSLSKRFERLDPVQRTTSAYGVRDTVIQQQYQDDGYASATEGSSGRIRASIREPTSRSIVRSKAERDLEAMPPPPRPSGILRLSREYHPDTPAAPELPAMYQEDGPRLRRPSVNRHSVSYDFGDQRIEPASSGRRRQSYYGQSASAASGETSETGGWEDKAAQAASYQEDVGGATVPLTADMLRRQRHQHQDGSSRSTKSSDSRDDSEYRKSATTRTTRSVSSPDDENVTIKVTGQARVLVGGAQIDCNDGGEIEIKRQRSIKGGSEWSSSEYGTDPRRIDDRRSRIDRPAGNSRRSSQSRHSYTRPSPQYPMGNFI